MTTRDLIRLSMLTIGVLAEGEDPSASQLQDARTTLGLLLDSWSTEKLFVYSIAEELFNFVGGQQVYQMGTGAPDFNSSRPIYIEMAAVRVYNGSPNQVDIPLKILNIDEWSFLSVKNTPSVFPTEMYVNYSYPYAELKFWPVPQQTNQVYLVSWKPLESQTDPNAQFRLPPGGVEAVMYNLAVRLAPMYGRPISPEVLGLAQSSKARYKVANSKPFYARVDAGLLPVDKVFNYLTGE